MKSLQNLIELKNSAGVQARIIHALLMREILTRFGRHNIGFLWLFVEPMMFTTGVTGIWIATKAFHGSSLPIAAFALTGYSSVLLWRNMPARCLAALQPNLSLMYHRNVRPVDVYAARLLLEAMGATISLVVLSLFYIAIGWIDPPDDVLRVIGGWLLLAWFGAALAVFVGTASERWEMVEKIWHPASYLMFPLSGAAYMVDALPQSVQYYAMFVPMVNGVEIVREGYFGNSVNAHYDIGYFLVFNLVLTLAALSQLNVISRNVVPE